jgi:hypothetical protein
MSALASWQIPFLEMDWQETLDKASGILLAAERMHCAAATAEEERSTDHAD